MLYILPFVAAYFYVCGRYLRRGRLHVRQTASIAGIATGAYVFFLGVIAHARPLVIAASVVTASVVTASLALLSLTLWKRTGSGQAYPLRVPLVEAAICFMTFGLYGAIWTGITWKEIRRIGEDKGMSPLGHALSMFVPLYGSWRVRAHFEAVNALQAAEAERPPRTRSGAMMGLSLVAFAFITVLWFPIALISSALNGPVIFSSFGGLAIAGAIIAFITSTGQGAMNSYLRALDPDLRYHVSWAKMAALWILGIMWLDGFALAVSLNVVYYRV